jgi:Flp pilus assembly protein TadG
VETALVLSIIMIIALGTVDLGRGIAAHVALNEAVQEGALFAGYRHHVSPGVTPAEIELRVQTSSPSVDAVANADVTVTGADCDQYLVVRGTYDMPVISPPASVIFGPTIELAVTVDATNMNSIDGVGACP